MVPPATCLPVCASKVNKRAKENDYPAVRSLTVFENDTCNSKEVEPPQRNNIRDEGAEEEMGRENQEGSHVKWAFGIGNEGIKRPVPLEDRMQGVIIDDGFPWWWSPVRAVNLNVSRIWFTSRLLVGLDSVVNSWCRGVPFEEGADPSPICKEAMMESSILFVGGRLPDSIATFIWTSKRLKAIVATKATRWTPPKPWSVYQFGIQHARLGGVTDGTFNIIVYTQSPPPLLTEFCKEQSFLRQDLRWVLKSNVEGSRTVAPKAPQPSEAAERVIYCGHNVIESASLLPFRKPDIQVRTEFRGLQFVQRKLTPSEKLMAMDVPERLSKSMESDVDRCELWSTLHTPIKVLTHAANSILTEMIDRQSGESWSNKRHKVVEEKPFTQLRKRYEEDQFSKATQRRIRTQWTGSLQPVPEDMAIELVDAAAATVELDDSQESVTVYRESLEDPNAKATKNDDAEVRTALWDNHLLEGLSEEIRGRDLTLSLKWLRVFGICIWRRKVVLSYLKWRKAKFPFPETVPKEIEDDARDCLRRACNSTWWQWDYGSRPFFWRWPDEYQKAIRVGVIPWFKEPVKEWTRRQRAPKCEEKRKLIRSKLLVIREKDYVEEGRINSLMSFFDVPKGVKDLRMVYDGTASGLNNSLWSPWFPLPSVNWLLRAVEPGYCMADNDVGEMFHNFMLHEDLRKFCGLDLTAYFRGKTRRRVWERWNRLAMGLRSSPYSAVQGMMMAQEVILGDRRDKNNVFRWASVRLNLPGSDVYDPTKAWVTKVRKDGTVAADIFMYVDDVRSCAPTLEEAWRASQRTSTVLGFLGLQDAARKRRDPGQETGAWTGSVVWTSGNSISVMTTQEKWDKTRRYIQWVSDNLSNAEGIDGKELKSIRGFLVYVARTYTTMVPYLKGIHATIDSWRTGRNEDGWRLKRKRVDTLQRAPQEETEDLDYLAFEPKLGLVDSQEEPKFVRPVRRLVSDIRCLKLLVASENPPLRKIRMSGKAQVVYGFGDASKYGFGSSIEMPDHNIHWRYGQWRLEEEREQIEGRENFTIRDEISSNYRELRNLVEALEDLFNRGLLDDKEVFMFTDNSTAEAAYFKGTSSSESLFNLVLRLRKLEMSGRCIIHMIHVSGTRMIWQGTDGLSRGDSNTGVMGGDAMLDFVPLHLSAIQREEKLVDWLKLWCSGSGKVPQGLGKYGSQVIFLTPDDWPTVLRFDATFVWTPPPAAADVAAEYMARSIHVRPNAIHVFVCPRLMTSRWRRFIRKTTDVYLSLPVGCTVWGKQQHEPLILAISFPLSRCKPWKQGDSPRCQRFAESVQSLLVNDFERAGPALREFTTLARSLAAV